MTAEQIKTAYAILDRMNHGSAPLNLECDYLPVRKDELLALITFYVTRRNRRVQAIEGKG